MTIFRHLTLGLMTVAAPAAAQPQFQDLSVLEAEIMHALGAGIGEPGGPSAPLDRRLRLQPCAEAVTVDPPAMNAVAVRCPSAGWRIRVPLVRAAQAAGAAAVAAQPVVRRGDQVEVVARTRSFAVSTSGVAEQDGAVGERVRVRIEGRSTPLTGEVRPDGRISLPGFN